MTATSTVSELPEQVLEFTLGEERYCVGIEHIEEIVTAGEVTALPDTPATVAGVMDLRGATTTILDAKSVFEVQSDQANQQVIIFDGEQRIGWLVDRANRVSSFEDASIDSGPESRYISGLVSDGERFVIWIDPETVNESVSM